MDYQPAFSRGFKEPVECRAGCSMSGLVPSCNEQVRACLFPFDPSCCFLSRRFIRHDGAELSCLATRDPALGLGDLLGLSRFSERPADRGLTRLEEPPSVESAKGELAADESLADGIKACSGARLRPIGSQPASPRAPERPAMSFRHQAGCILCHPPELLCFVTARNGRRRPPPGLLRGSRRGSFAVWPGPRSTPHPAASAHR